MGGFYPTPKPGPVDGSRRPANAPNNGSMGGRPSAPVPDASPMERLSAAPDPSFYPRTLPSAVGGDTMTPAGGGAVTSTPGTVAPSAAPGATTAPATPTININVGGGSAAPAQPAATAPPSNAGGEMWPDARGTGQAPGDPVSPPATNAGGEMWPDAQAPAPPPPVQLKKSPSTDDLARIPEGSEVVTPYGTGTKKNGEVAEYHLTPAGQEAHKRATLALRERAGATPFDGDPTAPPILPLVLGTWNYNPWAPGNRRWFR